MLSAVTLSPARQSRVSVTARFYAQRDGAEDFDKIISLIMLR